MTLPARKTSTCVDCGTPIIGMQLRCSAYHARVSRFSFGESLLIWAISLIVILAVSLAIVLAFQNCE